MLVIISGPSGVGKDTIIDALRRRDARPAASRPPLRRHVHDPCAPAGEVDGVDYHFVSRDEFLRDPRRARLLEANEVHGNWYGSPRDQVRDALAAGRDVILKIDVQGAQIVKEQVADALLDLRRPAVARDAVPAAADARDGDRRGARGPPARRGHRARRARATTTTSWRTRPARSSGPPSEIDAIIAAEHRRHPTTGGSGSEPRPGAR